VIKQAKDQYRLFFTFKKNNRVLQLNNINSNILLGGFKLTDITFNVLPSSRLAIIGSTGSGKSTLLKIIAGFIQHESGKILFNNVELLGPNFQLIAGAKGIGYLSQHFELRNNYQMHELLDMNNNLTPEQLNEICEACDILHLLERKSNELSGGEKQRVALARILVGQPKLLILDEPYSNLDYAHKKHLKQVINNVCAQFGITCILTSHEPADILSWAQQILVLHKGVVVQYAAAKDVYYKPSNQYCAALLGEYFYLNQTQKATLGVVTTQEFFRPQQTILYFSAIKNSVAGQIIQSTYLGQYYLYTINCSGVNILAYYTSQLNISQTVFIQIVAE
jgi:ABC-type sulfate/molybdate transport systems ATPase subunit